MTPPQKRAPKRRSTRILAQAPDSAEEKKAKEKKAKEKAKEKKAKEKAKEKKAKEKKAKKSATMQRFSHADRDHVLSRERHHIVDALSKANEATRKRVKELLVNTKYDPTNGIDFNAVNEDVAMMIYALVHGRLPPPRDAVATLQTFRETIGRSASEISDVKYILDGLPTKVSTLSTGLMELKNELKSSGERLVKGKPFIVKQANPLRARGQGAFAAIPFYRGQFLLQFTGKIVRKYEVKDADERERRES